MNRRETNEHRKAKETEVTKGERKSNEAEAGKRETAAGGKGTAQVTDEEGKEERTAEHAKETAGNGGDNAAG